MLESFLNLNTCAEEPGRVDSVFMPELSHLLRGSQLKPRYELSRERAVGETEGIQERGHPAVE